MSENENETGAGAAGTSPETTAPADGDRLRARWEVDEIRRATCTGNGVRWDSRKTYPSGILPNHCGCWRCDDAVAEKAAHLTAIAEGRDIAPTPRPAPQPERGGHSCHICGKPLYTCTVDDHSAAIGGGAEGQRERDTVTRARFNVVAGRWIPDEVADAMEAELFAEGEARRQIPQLDSRPDAQGVSDDCDRHHVPHLGCPECRQFLEGRSSRTPDAGRETRSVPHSDLEAHQITTRLNRIEHRIRDMVVYDQNRIDIEWLLTFARHEAARRHHEHLRCVGYCGYCDEGLHCPYVATADANRTYVPRSQWVSPRAPTEEA